MIFTGVHCQRMNQHPYYRCGACPHGFTGDGSSCSDINEVNNSLYNKNSTIF